MKDKVVKLDYLVENKPSKESRDFYKLRDSLNSLIDTFKKEFDIYDEETNGNK